MSKNTYVKIGICGVCGLELNCMLAAFTPHFSNWHPKFLVPFTIKEDEEPVAVLAKVAFRKIKQGHRHRDKCFQDLTSLAPGRAKRACPPGHSFLAVGNLKANLFPAYDRYHDEVKLQQQKRVRH